MKKYAISLLAFIPMRAKSSERSEMTTQILFGELMRVIEVNDNWTYVELRYDDYRGYVDTKMLTFISEAEYSRLNSLKHYFASDLYQYVEHQDQKIPIYMGATVYFEDRDKQKYFTVNGEKYHYSFQKREKTILDTARLLLNIPYLWGGKTPFGIDCSGFTQLVFRTNCISILRDASQQAEQGEEVVFLENIHAGDLAFFGDDENITHVGILIDKSNIIHASGKVKIDSFDDYGIFSNELKIHTHKLRFIKRIL
jgi:hypothetical protein